MGRLFCNGKKGFCERVFGTAEQCENVNCTGCEFADGTGAKFIDKITNYDRIHNMSIDETAEFLMDWFMRCSLGQAPLNVKEWLKCGAKMDGGKEE